MTYVGQGNTLRINPMHPHLLYYYGMIIGYWIAHAERLRDAAKLDPGIAPKSIHFDRMVERLAAFTNAAQENHRKTLLLTSA